MRFAKENRELTIAARKAGRFKDRRPRIGIRPDGTLRYELEGIDKSVLRNDVLERDDWTCVDSDMGACFGPLELSHEPPIGQSGGSDEMEYCKTRCRFHHRLLDGHGAPLHFSRSEDHALIAERGGGEREYE